jgi:hypothetical protein
MRKPGYHTTCIKKGVLGDLSKVQEELDEAKDAELQAWKVMLAVELSDLIGAVRAYADKHLSLSLDDLIKMSEITERAFKNGRRK